MLERIKILKFNIINTWQVETAFIGENWGNIFSTAFYTFSYIILIETIYFNVRTFAGYARDEMLLFFFIAQINYYTGFTWSNDNLVRLITDVNRGNLDMILTKPLPHLFYVSSRHFSILAVVRDAVVPLMTLLAIINWNNLHVTPINILAAIVILISGQIAMHVFLFLLTLTVFWQGTADEVVGIGYVFADQEIPYEGLNALFKFIFTFIIPTFIASAISASVLFGKSNAMLMTSISIAVAALALYIKNYAWQAAMRNYTSASS